MLRPEKKIVCGVFTKPILVKSQSFFLLLEDHKRDDQPASLKEDPLSKRQAAMSFRVNLGFNLLATEITV